MPVNLECENLSLTEEAVVGLWESVREARGYVDEIVNIKCVSEAEIRQLNKKYRVVDEVTNVLTFSYNDFNEEGKVHDIALCLTVAEREAQQRGEDKRDYVALLLVHALLHVTGLDHAESDEAVGKAASLEQEILKQNNFTGSIL